MYALNVKPGSAAAQAGVQPGDLITAVEGSPVQSFGDVCDIVQSRTAGQIVSVEAIAVDRNDDSEPFTPLTPMALSCAERARYAVTERARASGPLVAA